MTRNYKRTTNRQSWNQEQMKNAIKAVNDGILGYMKAAEAFDVPKSTLQNRVTKYRLTNDLDLASQKGLGRFKPTFSAAEELSLVEYILDMERRLFGLNYKDLRRLAFQFAECNNIKHNFNKTLKLAGEDWLACFMKRNSGLSLRAGEPTSIARAIGFNKANVTKFFDLLETEIKNNKILPTNIFNVDEMGITTVPKRQSKIIALKGKKHVGLASSAERGQLTTAIICVSASGHYVPPMMIFPRVRMKAELLDGAAPGTVAVCHPSGWVQSEIFVEWLNHFINSVKPTKENPTLLLLDGHKSHTQNLPLIEKARQHGVIIISLPPHCTHKLQPLDVSFMGPVSTYYAQEVNIWLRNNPGRVVTQFQLSKLFGAAYIKAATIKTALSGFVKTGVYPTNRNVFNDVDFSPSETTEIEYSTNVDDAELNDCLESDIVTAQSDMVSSPISSTLNHITLEIRPEPFSSIHEQSTERPKQLITPADIMPIPKIQKFQRRKTNHRKGKTAIITSSPYRNELLNSSTKKNTLNFKAVMVQPPISEFEKNPTTTSSICHQTDNLVVQPASTRKRKVTNDLINNFEKKKRKLNNNLPRKPQRQMKGNHNEENYCLYCRQLYGSSRSHEDWIQCLECKRWAHECCTNWAPIDLDCFKCLGCVDV